MSSFLRRSNTSFAWVGENWDTRELICPAIGPSIADVTDEVEEVREREGRGTLDWMEAERRARSEARGAK